MKMRQLLSIAVFALSAMAPVVVAGECKKDNLLSAMVATNPIKTLTAGYLMTKDFVHYQVGAHAPHVVVYNKSVINVFPELKYYVKDASRYGRYRNVGAVLLAYTACNASNQQ
jgi:hypothetical protein